jgi:hypothetical protein
MAKYDKRRCVICNEKIDQDKDQYVRLTDFTGKKQTGECIYHTTCWRKRFKITQQKIHDIAIKEVMSLVS